MAGFLFSVNPSGGGMGWDLYDQSGLFAPTTGMWPGRGRYPRHSTSGEAPSLNLASMLDDILGQFLTDEKKEEIVSSPPSKSPGREKIWSEVIQLPRGFTPGNVYDVTVQDGKVVFKLVKVSRDHLGFHSVTAVCKARIPEDVQEGSLKLVPLDRSRISIYGLKKNTTDGKTGDSIEAETNQEKPTPQSSDAPDTFEIEEEKKTPQGEDVESRETRDFEWVFDLEPFDPADVKVKLSGNDLFIDAVHKDEDNDDVSSLEMHRSLTIPQGVDLDQLKSRVSDTGKLVISAPYVTPEKPRERIITVQRQ